MARGWSCPTKMAARMWLTIRQIAAALPAAASASSTASGGNASRRVTPVAPMAHHATNGNSARPPPIRSSAVPRTENTRCSSLKRWTAANNVNVVDHAGGRARPFKELVARHHRRRRGRSGVVLRHELRRVGAGDDVPVAPVGLPRPPHGQARDFRWRLDAWARTPAPERRLGAQQPSRCQNPHRSARAGTRFPWP